jgi:acyl carrier protein
MAYSATTSPLGDEEVLEMIKKAVRSSTAAAELPVEEVVLSHKLSEVGIDSMAAVEVAAELEHALNVRLPDDQLARVTSVRDLVSLVQKQLRGPISRARG